MLDGNCSFTTLDDDVDIYWGAYVGTADEILISGALHDVADEILRVRAAAKRTNGWVMDTYLLSRRSSPD
jgi:precorrin-6A synthase